MLNLKKRKKGMLMMLLSMVFIFSFAPTALAEYTSVYIYPDDDKRTSMPHYYSKGEGIRFYGSSESSSTHHVALVLLDPTGDAVDTAIILPGDSGIGDVHTAERSGYYRLGLGCGGNGQDGCTASGRMEPY